MYKNNSKFKKLLPRNESTEENCNKKKKTSNDFQHFKGGNSAYKSPLQSALRITTNNQQNHLSNGKESVESVCENDKKVCSANVINEINTNASTSNEMKNGFAISKCENNSSTPCKIKYVASTSNEMKNEFAISKCENNSSTPCKIKYVASTSKGEDDSIALRHKDNKEATVKKKLPNLFADFDFDDLKTDWETFLHQTQFETAFSLINKSQSNDKEADSNDKEADSNDKETTKNEDSKEERSFENNNFQLNDSVLTNENDISSIADPINENTPSSNITLSKCCLDEDQFNSSDDELFKSITYEPDENSCDFSDDDDDELSSFINSFEEQQNSKENSFKVEKF